MHFTVKEPVFGSRLHVFIGEPYDNLLKHARKTYGWKKRTIPAQGEGTDGKCVYDPNYALGYLWIEKEVNTTRGIALVAHEVGHFAFHCFRVIGESSERAEESFLYFQMYYLREILERAQKKQNKQ